MVFSSLVFLLIFLPVSLIVYYILPAKCKNAALLAASLVFYAWGEPKYILILLLSIAINYASGLALEKARGKSEKLILALSVLVNLGLLCFFKYTDFALETVNSVFGVGISALKIALPVGISFYTFQALSYTVDVFRGTVGAQHNIITFATYISMFPQLIAGPIVRYSDIESALLERKPQADKIAEGIFRFIIGLSKKVLIANQVGDIWNEISQLESPPVLTAWIGAAAFMLQIYFDFSGYSDMAIGLGKMLGFEFAENFDYPYESKSVSEFWRRWHISLGSFFRDYLYIPLGGSRKGALRQIINLFIVWLLTGLWHGAGYNFILWGLYFFVVLVLEKTLLLRILNKLPAIIRHIYTLLAVLFSWVIFACDGMAALSRYVRALFGFNGFADRMSVYYLLSDAALLVIAAVFSTSAAKKLFSKLDCAGARIAIAAVLYALCIFFIAQDSYNPFLYFRF